MKIKNRWTVLIIAFLVLCISLAIKISFSLDNSITSSEYTISDNTIYINPTNLYLKAREVFSKVDSEYDLSIINSNNEALNKNDFTATGYKLNVNNTNYDLVVMGDVTGDGKINLGDVSKLYNTYKGKETLTGDFFKAGKVTNNTSISLGDVSKLYNFYKGKTALSYYSDEYKVETIVKYAKNFYNSNPYSNKIGSNIINELNINDKADSDSIIVNKDGNVELKILKNNVCYRKSALSDDIDLLESKLCNANIDGYVSNNGKLHVSGRKILNERNEEVRLVGASGADANYPEIENSYTSLHSLKNWGANVFRFFTNYYGAGLYQTQNIVNNKEGVLERLYYVIDNAILNDMYLLVTFTPDLDSEKSISDQAIEFYNEVTTKYPNDPHLIFEIWNEPPATVTWDFVKTYAEAVIPEIRKKSPDSIVIVGTPSYGYRIDDVVDHEINLGNVMYTHHCYMNSMGNNSINRLITALDNNIPVFVTEWGATVVDKTTDDEVLESQVYAYYKILKKYNLSNIMFCFATNWGAGDLRFSLVKKGEWDEELHDSVLKENGKLIKNIMSNNFTSNINLLKQMSGTFGVLDDTYRSAEWKDKIVSIEFKSTLSAPDNFVVSWDVSFAKDNSIIGYLLPTNTSDRYKLVIAANGTINAPMDSTNLFSNLTNLESIDFTNFSTKYITNISAMFAYDINLVNLDLSSFDTTMLITTINAFNRCEKLESINFTNWSPKLKYMSAMFYNCYALNNLDLSHFDVSEVTSFDNVFDKNKSLTNINLSNFNPNNVTSMKRMFYDCRSLETVNLSNFVITSETLKDEALTDVNATATFIVKNNDVKELLETIASSTIDFQIK